MKKQIIGRTIILTIITCLITSNCASVFGSQTYKNPTIQNEIEDKHIEIQLSFSTPEVVQYGNYSVVRVKETNHNQIILFNYDPGKPVLPVNISIFELPFGSKILNVEYNHVSPLTIDVPTKIAFGIAQIDSINSGISIDSMDKSIYENSDPYPCDWVSYHTGGGLSDDEPTTFLVLRVYPVRYFPLGDYIEFISSITVNVTYQEPEQPILTGVNVYDLLVITPSEFKKHLQPLVCHKNHHGVKTKMVTLDEVCHRMYFEGRDLQEKIKYYIKYAIEYWGIKNVLLVGGVKGQGLTWSLPVRYSHVVPPEEQEYPEPDFVSDLYYADIYDGEGHFSSWDSNHDNKFAVWNATYKDKMDLYPDVYLGRIPCRNIYEVKTMVNKIIKYENERNADKNWFKNLLLIGGDSYVTRDQWPEGTVVIEGELACEEALSKMPGFNPLKVYASEKDINRQTVNNALNKGAGFAYFCGHGSKASWGTHFPPATDKGSNWTTGYQVDDMIFLRNKEKLPITVVGGCHNGEFDISILYNIIKEFKKKGLEYLRPSSRFWFDGWIPNCWAWWLTSKPNGGAIACIANTGLGTHGDGDQDNNSVVDYLEVLDGWLEIRFLELYGTEHKDILGENHAQTITEYLNKFLGDESSIDVKMVQQWELFGDPSLKIGGYI